MFLFADDTKLFCSIVSDLDVDRNLKFHQHAAAAAAKADCILGLISKCFEHLDIDTLPLLYKTLVRTILE